MNRSAKRAATGMLLPLLAAACCLSLRLTSILKADAIVDEAVYASEAGVLYANYLRQGDFGLLIRSRENYEHPPLVKLLYGAAIAATGNHKDPAGALRVSRWISAVLSAAEAGMLCFISPLAAIFFCVQTQQILYSSRAYLDSPSSFFALAAVFAFLAGTARRGGRADAGAGADWNPRVALSAILLGAALASKYINAVVALPIGIALIAAFKDRPRFIVTYAAAAAAAFFVLDPAIWTHPWQFIKESFLFHNSLPDGSSRYRQYVEFIGHEPKALDHFQWLLENRQFPYMIYMPRGTDGLIFTASLAGLPTLYNLSPLLLGWYASAAAFLLLYPIKFPHYTLVLIPVMALSAAEFVRFAAKDARRLFASRWKLPSWLNESAACSLILAALACCGAASAWRHRGEEADMAEAEICYGISQLQLGNRDEAERLFRKSVARADGRPRPTAHMALSKLLQDLGYLAEAESEARRALRERPGHYSTHMRLGDVLLTTGKTDAALAEYLAADPAAIVDPRHRAILYLSRGRAYLAKSDLKNAALQFRTAAQLKPDDATIQEHIKIVARREKTKAESD